MSDGWRSLDFRYSWTREALEGIDVQLSMLPKKHVDGIDLCEHAELLIGLGFVALQTYVASAMDDLKTVVGSDRRPAVSTLLTQNAPNVSGLTVSTIEAIWQAANFFKHQTEWSDWTEESNRRTVEMLGNFGISRETEFPCQSLLAGVGCGWEMAPRADVVGRWRQAWFFALTGEH